MAKPTRNQTLVEWSGQHLFHELNMFWQLAEALPQMAAGLSTSAFVELFAIHLRNLIEFFCMPSESKYVRAQDFFDNPADWPPNMPGTLKDALRRANEEVSHLTWGRKAGNPPAWDTAHLLKEIEPIAKHFAAKVPITRLDVKIRNFLNLPSQEMRAWLGGAATYSNIAVPDTASPGGASSPGRSSTATPRRIK